VAAAGVPSLDTPPISVQFSATYYTNVAGSSDTIAALRGLNTEDVVYAPSLNLNLVEPLGGATVFLNGYIGYDIHQRNAILDRERISVTGGANTRLAICDTTLSGVYARSQSDLTDLVVVATNNTQETFTAALDATCNTGGRLIPSFGVAHTWSTNSAIAYLTQEYESTNANAALAYNAGSLGTISLIGSYGRTDYPNRFFVLPTGLQSDGYNMYSGGVRYENDIMPDLNLTASVSGTSLETDNNVGASFDGITYDATLTLRATSRMNFHVGLSRQTKPSMYLNSSYSVAESYFAGVDYRVSARITAAINASHTHSDYSGGALLPGLNITDQTIKSVSGSLSYTISPTFSATLNAGYTQRDANVLGYSYSGAQVGLALSKAF
jgi:hypothetical protein